MARTLRLRADDPKDVDRAAAILRRGGLVAFPTETVYGLGANALSPKAVEGIFAAKQRPGWDPVIVHLASADALGQIATIGPALTERVRLLTTAFWPGPLTLLLPRTKAVPNEVTAGRSAVGVRVPSHPVAQALLRAAAVPIAAPSANRFGHISPTTAQHVLDDLEGRIDAVLDGGAARVGLESSVLDPACTPMILYRAGALTAAMLRNAAGVAVELFSGSEAGADAEPASLPSPGVGIRHYAPEVSLILADGDAAALQAQIELALPQISGKIGVLLPADWTLAEQARVDVERWGVWDNAATLAAGLFAGLRALEGRGVALMICPLPDGGGLGDALRDRLGKAARPR